MQDKKDKYLMLKFKGDKVELKNQLKSWCALSGKTMNGTIIKLIEQLLSIKESNK